MKQNIQLPYENDFTYKYIQVNNIKLHVAFVGPEDGNPVILLHGFPDASFGWTHQIKALSAQNFYVIAPDQRGYNLSDKPKGKKNYRGKLLVSDIIGLADALNIEKFNLAGHDFGAMVSWNLVASYPQRVKKLAIFNVPHPRVIQKFLKESKKQRRKSWYFIFFRIPFLPELLIRLSGWRMLTKAMDNSFSKEELTRYKTTWKQRGALTAMINWYRGFFQKPKVKHKQTTTPTTTKTNKHRRKLIEVPTVIGWGKQDPHLMWEMADHSATYVKNCRVQYFEDANHWVLVDEPEKTSRLLIDFFQDD
ncbi:MAG: alpha/beta fold hydrolase [Promethearchaeota archaeon]